MNSSANSDWTSHEMYLIASKGYALYLQGRYREAAMVFEGLSSHRTQQSLFPCGLGHDLCRSRGPSARIRAAEPVDLSLPK
jgi:hypothetical protein